MPFDSPTRLISAIAILGTAALLTGMPTHTADAQQESEAAGAATRANVRYSVASIEDLVAQVGPDTPVGGYTSLFFTLVHDGRDIQVLGAAIAGRFFAAVDAVPGEGRLLDVLDDQPNAAPAVVVSHELWQDLFGGRPIVGEDLSLSGTFYKVVGIVPPGFSFPEQGTVLWTSVAATLPEAVSVTEARFLRVVGPTSY